jgi:hypothetical protein
MKQLVNVWEAKLQLETDKVGKVNDRTSPAHGRQQNLAQYPRQRTEEEGSTTAHTRNYLAVLTYFVIRGRRTEM